ncbi:uncharacterized protein IUM83_16379 [Phytophthora cinnamomi]|uniref:uncharacterized protein n=1 Tax=Phytophthora cinnamomi TaxID=4785 RepID=UPI0035595AC8|nr:hypothetical protein IUM83_16379 [Phytophthora cinnamomi]
MQCFSHFGNDDGLGENTFKQLWRELCKEGWKARKPTGVAKDHRYLKPGIKGRLDETRRGIDFFEGEVALMAFARRSGRLDLHAPAVPSTRKSVRGPIGNQASYAVIGQPPPSAAIRTPEPMAATTSTGTGAVPVAAAIPQDAPRVPGMLRSKLAGRLQLLRMLQSKVVGRKVLLRMRQFTLS